MQTAWKTCTHADRLQAPISANVRFVLGEMIDGDAAEGNAAGGELLIVVTKLDIMSVAAEKEEVKAG